MATAARPPRPPAHSRPPSRCLSAWTLWFMWPRQWSLEHVRLEGVIPSRLLPRPHRLELSHSTYPAYNHGLRLLISQLAVTQGDVEPSMVSFPPSWAQLRDAVLSVADSSVGNANNAIAAYLSLCKVADFIPPSSQRMKGLWGELNLLQRRLPPRRKAPPLPAAYVKSAVLASSVCLSSRKPSDLAIRDVMLGLICFVAMLRKSDAANAYFVTDPPSDGRRFFLYVAKSKTGPHLVEVIGHPSCSLLDPFFWVDRWTNSRLYKSSTRSVQPLQLGFIDGVAPFTTGSAMPLLPCSFGPRVGLNLSANSVGSALMSWLSSWAPTTRGVLRSFTAHSWRRGGAQAARDAGVPSSVIHATGHWKDPSTMNRIYLDGVNTSIAGAVFPVTHDELAQLNAPVSSSAPGAMKASSRAVRVQQTPTMPASSPVASPQRLRPSSPASTQRWPAVNSSPFPSAPRRRRGSTALALSPSSHARRPRQQQQHH